MHDLVAAVAATIFIALLPSAAEAASKKPTRAASLSVRLKTGTQAKALRTNRLRVRVVARRATRVRLSAVVRRTVTTRSGRRATRSLRIARPRTVSLRRGKARIVSLRLNRRGRRLLAGCAAQRVTVVARDLRRPRSQARRSRSLRLDPGRCGARADRSRTLPGCAAADAPGGEWPFYSGTLDGHREQLEEKSIDTGNVVRARRRLEDERRRTAA